MKIAALFPGQNSHAIGMGQAVAAAYPVAEAVLAEAEGVLPGLRALMANGPLEDLTLTANQQPALVTASVAAYRAWQDATGLTPIAAAGHSLGEYSAHVAAGTLALTDAVRLTHRRGTLMQDAVPPGLGAMSAVMGDPGVVAQVCEETEGVVEVANYNAPTQTVISGRREAVEEAGATLKARGLKVIPLKVSAPFHCTLMRPAREALAPDLQLVALGEMAFPVVVNVTAEAISTPTRAPQLLTDQITGSVQWVASVRELAALGADTFIEFGSGTVLTGLVKRILPDARTYNIHTPEDIQAFRGAVTA